MAAPVYISTNSLQGFQFRHILANTCYLLFFDDGHSNKCKMISHGISLMVSDAEHFFIHMLDINNS